MNRSAGILMPIFSLPSPHGIGTLGRAAREFLDFLRAGGQSYWQLLPVGPTSYGDSPYQSFSSFAGNPYFIDLDDLAADGLLERAEYGDMDWGGPDRVDYALLYEKRYPVLRKAVARLLAAPPADYAPFLEDNGDWLEDYALFMALKGENGGVSWDQWPEGERLRRPAALSAARERLAGELDFWRGVQYLFFRQWDALKALAGEKGISIIGDLPIYAARDSADMWADPRQFQTDENLNPVEVAGCPPDAFTADGQLWGNPLFDWERMREDGYRWWLRRIGFQFRLFDVLRIDHFRGFDEYYAIPFGDKTARNGRWKPGPGLDFFQAVNKALGKRQIIAEDLGFLTPSVRRLLRATGYPGMKVLEFAFDPKGADSEYLPHNYPHNCVVYAGTHDNETLAGWFGSITKEEMAMAR
ncbi:MAG: 4-alpha-glucanotransferase, partial [Oscillospiraceae bacterium]|nr:4-alpha-glucanotransferase [Oscillospiraceae bacterium]